MHEFNFRRLFVAFSLLLGCTSGNGKARSSGECSGESCPPADAAVTDALDPPDAGDLDAHGAGLDVDDPVPPECHPPCQNGGRCVATDGPAACDCPVGTFGPRCEHTCTRHPLEVMACSSVAAPDAFFTVTPGSTASTCLVKVPLVVDAPSGTAGPVTATVSVGDVTVSRFELVNTKGNRWEGDGLAPADAEYTARIASTAGSLSVTAATAPSCPDPSPAIPCERAFQPGLDFSYECSGDTPGCTTAGLNCGDGCIQDLWVAFVVDRPRMVTELLLRFDWWAKRPTDFEIWAASRLSETPGDGAVLIYAGTAAGKGHQCVAGQPCAEDVPDECCPDGRDAPQRIDEGALIAKYERVTPSFARAQIYYLRVRATEDPKRLIVQDIELAHSECTAEGGAAPMGACQTWESGPGARCGADEWCAPYDPATGSVWPTCVPDGPAKILESCDETVSCVAGAYCGGGRCVEFCDRVTGLASCDGTFDTCTGGFDDANHTYAFGMCSPGSCALPFDSSDCPIGTWCKPEGGASGRCELAGPKLMGQACSTDTDCAAGLGCFYGHCARLCNPGSTGPGADVCTPSETCVAFTGAPFIGYCSAACDPITGPACPNGLACAAAELLGTVVPLCFAPPSFWPNAAGLAFLEACPADEPLTLCGPTSTCVKFDVDTSRRCVSICRFSKGPAGPEHPDCAPGFNCVDAATSGALGLCVPPAQ